MIGKLNVTLPLGLIYQGKCYKHCQVTLLSVGGEMRALDTLNTLGVDLSQESHSSRDITLINLAYLAQQVEFEGLPEEALSPDVLIEALASSDYAELQRQIEVLQKKRLAYGENTLNNANAQSVTV